MCTLPVLFLLASAAYVAPVQFGDGLDAAEFIFGGKPVNAGEIPMLAAILFKDIDGKPDSCGVDIDIAILEVENAVTLNANVRLAVLTKSDDTYGNGKQAVIAGFGTYKLAGKHSLRSPHLLSSNVTTLKTAACK
ncbi:hypothetical protein QR680_014512 [Steinernema hermaphroditum]|uniref:Peptidase S1 domain-containing protein n=1 Tax=Steinernema hermaphroditum TaxID=289476 RepID=A0AA39I940_9BILA|nr:hypothetical protein QR680_014512 [Steinernema hermaphroditum]